MCSRLICLFLGALLLAAAAPVYADHANIMVYHRFGDARYPSTNIATGVFRDQLAFLKENDYTVLTFGEIARRLENGREIPERCAVLTVDDAFSSFLTTGLPLLEEFGYPATLFVSTASVGQAGYLSWDQLRLVREAGIEIGNHSHTHDYLLERRGDETRAEWRKRVHDDILLAQRLLEKHLGVTPESFAYPYGEYSPELQKIAAEVGFAAAAAQQSGVAYPGSDMMALPRFPMGGPYATLEGFLRKVAMRPLPVEVLEPAGPVIGENNPPRLLVEIDDENVDLDRLNCFAQGQVRCRLEAVPDVDGRYAAQAKGPLSGRRSKYTLTAPGRNGEHWYWYSHLWVQPKNAGETYP